MIKVPRNLSARNIDIPIVEFIFGLAFNQDECKLQPDGPGICELTSAGCGVPVALEDERLID
jgi:hypothetical protein